MPSSASHANPIFIIGIRSRSGTTYLSHLLRLHPDCGDPPAPIWEDFLLTHADLLARYARSTNRHWHHWVIAEGVEERLEEQLLQGIGNGLVSFLASRVGSGRLVTKMPGVRNLEYFSNFFHRLTCFSWSGMGAPLPSQQLRLRGSCLLAQGTNRQCGRGRVAPKLFYGSIEPLRIPTAST